MKKLLVVLVAATLCGAAGVAQATMLVQDESSVVSDLDGACWKLSDGGFDLTGDPLAQTMYLQSVTYKRGSGNETEGNLYLKVFEGNTGGNGTFVGVSTTTVNFNGLAVGQTGTWTFNNLSLDKDTVYSYIAAESNDSSNPTAKMRLSLANNTDPLTSGGVIDGDVMRGDLVGYDPYVEIVASIPEPATLSLLAFGGGLVLLKRRRA